MEDVTTRYVSDVHDNETIPEHSLCTYVLKTETNPNSDDTSFSSIDTLVKQIKASVDKIEQRFNTLGELLKTDEACSDEMTHEDRGVENENSQPSQAYRDKLMKVKEESKRVVKRCFQSTAFKRIEEVKRKDNICQKTKRRRTCRDTFFLVKG